VGLGLEKEQVPFSCSASSSSSSSPPSTSSYTKLNPEYEKYRVDYI
jgi:hypothetical protein